MAVDELEVAESEDIEPMHTGEPSVRYLNRFFWREDMPWHAAIQYDVL